MGVLFYISLVFVINLIITVFTGYELHEVASFMALILSAFAVIGIINVAARVTVIIKDINKAKEENDDQSGT